MARNTGTEMPRYSAELRERVVRAVAKGEGVTSAARRMGVATDQTAYAWLKAAGLSAPYGSEYPKELPPPEDGPLFTDFIPTPPRTSGPRKSYAEQFKRDAVQALCLAVAEGEPGPLNAVCAELQIEKSMLREWAYKRGYMAHGGGLDWDKLRQDGTHGPGASAAHQEDAPPPKPPAISNGAGTAVAVLVVNTREGRQEFTEDMLRRLWEDREHLLAENNELKRQREVFMAATTIYGNERPR